MPLKLDPEFRRGLRMSLPIVLAAAPFGLLFGALAVENGMTVLQAIFMSATLYAGASQMVGIELFGTKVAPWLIVFSIFAVNFRHILYSASLGIEIHALHDAAESHRVLFHDGRAIRRNGKAG